METIGRRDFIGLGAGASALALLGCGGGGSPGMGMGPAGTAGAIPAGLPFAPPVLASAQRTANLVEITLTAAPTTIALGNGVAPEFWTFNGSIPGPTIDVNEGDRVRILFRNRLPLESTIHWHGLPVPADQDGNPMDPVAPGSDRLYEFSLPAGSAGTYWYHPHAHRTTHEQVYRGLAGLFLVRDPRDPLALAGVPDIPLVVTDLRLDGNGRIAPNTMMDVVNGRIGDTLLVNGLRTPRLAITQGQAQRWRVLNATNARYLDLSLAGNAFAVVASDGGLLPAPLEGVTRLLLAPAERAELVVVGSDSPGGSVSFGTLAYGHGMMMGGLGSSAQSLLALETVEGTAPAFSLPATLRPIVALPEPSAAHLVVLSGDGMMRPFAIDGRAFDMMRIDTVSVRGQVERWDVVNATFMDHPFHIHGTQFQVVSRTSGGRTSPEPRLAWKDTVNLPPGESVALRVRHEEAGLRMYHCHILEHEDAGMMAILSVT